MDQLASKEVVDHILAHHGVRGMKWGVRKGSSASEPTVSVARRAPAKKGQARITTSGGENHPAHPDALKARAIQQLLAKSGSHALSNGDIRSLVERQNLEQQLTRLNPKVNHLERLRKGNAAVQELMKLHGNVKSVAAVANTIK